MKKILLISDSPFATTGLGRMSKYFLKMFPDFEWVVWGFLHPEYNIRSGAYIPYYDKKKYPNLKLYTPKSYTDNQFGFEYIPTLIEQEKPDYVLTSFDFDKSASIASEIKKLQFTMDFKWINYFPVDREDFFPMEITAFRYPDINVCITKFGQNKIKSVNSSIKIEQIYHPIDASEFPVLDSDEISEFKTKFWKDIKKNTFIIGSVNRSFARKDTGRLVRVLSQYIKENQNLDLFAYLHGSRITAEGLDLAQVAYINGLPEKKMAFLPSTISEVDGIPNEILNKIYQSLDLFITISTGEGFGYSTVEALLTGTPIIAPANTSFPELVQDFGCLIEPSEFTYLNLKGNTAMWPVVNMDDVYSSISEVINNYKLYKEKALAGQKWVKENLSLDIISSQWRKILT